MYAHICINNAGIIKWRAIKSRISITFSTKEKCLLNAFIFIPIFFGWPLVQIFPKDEIGSPTFKITVLLFIFCRCLWQIYFGVNLILLLSQFLTWTTCLLRGILYDYALNGHRNCKLPNQFIKERRILFSSLKVILSALPLFDHLLLSNYFKFIDKLFYFHLCIFLPCTCFRPLHPADRSHCYSAESISLSLPFILHLLFSSPLVWPTGRYSAHRRYSSK